MNPALSIILSIAFLVVIAGIIWVKLIQPAITIGKTVKQHVDAKHQAADSASLLDEELKRFDEQ